MSDLKEKQYLETIYSDLSGEGGALGSVQSIYNKVKQDGEFDISQQFIEKFLESKPSYTLNRKILTHFPTTRVIIGGINQLHQADLIDLSKYQQYNEGVNFILIIEDVFSKFVWAIPLKNKSNVEVLRALKQVYKSYSDFPSSFSSDKGTEFTGKKIQSFFKSNDVNIFQSHRNTKAQFVERVIETLKHKIFTYLTLHKTFKYIDVLPNIISSYNHTVNRETKTFPANVSARNAPKIFTNLYGDNIIDIVHSEIASSESKLKSLDLKEGDFVRISIKKGQFAKRYHNNFSNEVFKVKEIKRTKPVTINLEDLSEEAILGKFYLNELQKIIFTSEVFYVEKILNKFVKNGKKYVEVEWRDYGKKFDSIVSADDLLEM
jgi:hypothetical protein